MTSRPKGRSRFDPTLMRLLAKADPSLTQQQINKAIQDTAEEAERSSPATGGNGAAAC